MGAVPALLWSALPDEPGSSLPPLSRVGEERRRPPESGRARCFLCAHRCVIARGKSGRCRVRVNRNGALYSLVADHVSAANLDPVEKKPLFHFLPGSLTFSIGTEGCNMTCSFCQNHTLSQGRIPDAEAAALPPPAELSGKLVDAALAAGAASISYTYNEPTLFFELLEPTARLAQTRGLANILVSNAYQSQECLEALRPLIRAANFDLKAFTDDFYRRHCGARLAPVLDTLRRAVSFGWWVEVTTLLIPGCNDSREELRDMARFIHSELGAHVPWHISRFRPMFRMTDRPVTPLSSLERALDAGREAGLSFVYAGNVPGHDSESTRCPLCRAVAVPRRGHTAPASATGLCPSCGTSIPGVWRTAGRR